MPAPPSPRRCSSLLLASSALALAVAGAADAAPGESTSLGRALLDLTPERIQAFQVAMHELTGKYDRAAEDGYALLLQSDYVAREPTGAGDELYVPALSGGRDLVAEEAFLMSGREDDYQQAGRRWVQEQLRGSSGGSGSSSRIQPRLSWDHGPEAGLRVGNFAATVGERSWRLKWRRAISPKLPGWVVSAWLGNDEGEQQAAFSLGRSLVRARLR